MKQSARLIYKGKDHNDIIYGGYHHDAMYRGDALLWEKSLNGRINVFTAPITLTYFRRVEVDYGNGLLVLMDAFDRIYTTADFINYNVDDTFTQSTGDNSRLERGVFFTGSVFIIALSRTVTKTNYYYCTNDGTNYYLPNKIITDKNYGDEFRRVDREFMYFRPSRVDGRANQLTYKTRDGINLDLMIPASKSGAWPYCDPEAIASINGEYFLYGTVIDLGRNSKYYKTYNFSAGDYTAIENTAANLTREPKGYNGAFLFNDLGYNIYASYNGTDFINFPYDQFDDQTEPPYYSRSMKICFNPQIQKWGMCYAPVAAFNYGLYFRILDAEFKEIVSMKFDSYDSSYGYSAIYGLFESGNSIIALISQKNEVKIIQYKEN